MKSLLGFLVICVGMTSAATRQQIQPVSQSTGNDPGPEAKPPVTKADIQIVQRARKILDSPAKWNRKDNRECPTPPQQSKTGIVGGPGTGEKTFSLYCALEEATKEVTGDFKHRGAAISPQQPKIGLTAIPSIPTAGLDGSPGVGDPGCKKPDSSSTTLRRTAASTTIG